MKILLIFPTIFEGAAFFKNAGVKSLRVGAVAKLQINSKTFVGLVSGYGSEASLNRLKNCVKIENPDFAILCGFCGACIESLKEGDFIFDTKSEVLTEVFNDLNLYKADIACEPKVADFKRKCELAGAGFEAVDMESKLFLDAFNESNFASFRAVSDSLNSKIPAEFFDAMIDKSTGKDRFFCRQMFSVLNPLRNPLLMPRLLLFGISASKVSKKYAKKLLELVEKLAKI